MSARTKAIPARHLALWFQCFAWALLPLAAHADCLGACQSTCNADGASAIGDPGNLGAVANYEVCMNNCQHSCRGEDKPPDRFAAFAHSAKDDVWMSAYRAKTREEAEAVALKACRQKSESCEIFTWFKNACGAVVGGEKKVLGTPPGTADRDVPRERVVGSLMEQCARVPGNGDCRVRIAVCANESSPEDKARAKEREGAVLGLMERGFNAIQDDFRKYQQQTSRRPPPASNWERAFKRERDGPSPADVAALKTIAKPEAEIREAGPWMGSEYAVPAGAQPEVKAQLRQIWASKQKVLRCNYVAPGFSQAYALWYEKVPMPQAKLLAASPQHPLRPLGDQAFSQCPEKLADVERYVAENMKTRTMPIE